MMSDVFLKKGTPQYKVQKSAKNTVFRAFLDFILRGPFCLILMSSNI